MVLLAGASPAGAHLFWMTAPGFDKSAFFPGDAFPEPVIRVASDRIVVLTREGSETRTHEMLWTGP